MTGKKRGLEVMCRAVNGAGALPLQFAKRDQQGPQDQEKGAIVTNAKEVDGIAMMRWLETYKGKFDNRHRQVAIYETLLQTDRSNTGNLPPS